MPSFTEFNSIVSFVTGVLSILTIGRKVLIWVLPEVEPYPTTRRLYLRSGNQAEDQRSPPSRGAGEGAPEQAVGGQPDLEAQGSQESAPASPNWRERLRRAPRKIRPNYRAGGRQRAV